LIIKDIFPKMAMALNVLIATTTLKTKATPLSRAVNVMTQRGRMRRNGRT